MKKILFTLGFLISMSAMAQHEATATFDFNHPETLNPQVTPHEEPGGEVLLEDYTFTSNGVSIYFTLDADGRVGARLHNGNDLVPYLYLARANSLHVQTTGDDVVLKKIVFTGALGDFNLYQGEAGTYTMNNYTWEAGVNEHVNDLRFWVTGYGADIHSIAVTYSSPADILTPIAVTPEEGAEMTAFNSFELDFANDLTLAQQVPEIVMSHETGTTVTLIPTVLGNKLVLTATATPEVYGTYSLTIPAGVVYNADGFCNTELTYNYVLNPDYATFALVSTTPDFSSEVNEIPNTFTMQFAGSVGYVATQNLRIKNAAGETIRQVQGILDNKDYSKVVFTFQNNQDNPITTRGIYSLVVPEGYVWNNEYEANAEDNGKANGARYNKEFSIEFNVGGVKEISNDVLANAQQYLDMTGVGYPAADAVSRTILAEVLLNADQIYSDADVATALDDYLNEANVELPATDHYYTIAAINAEGKKLFLQYDEQQAVVLTDNEDKAAVFQAVANEDGTTVFTVGSKYLHQLISTNEYAGTSPRNVTDTYNSEINDLKLKPFTTIFNSDDDTAVFGLMGIYGNMGTNDLGEAIMAHAMVNFGGLAFYTSPARTVIYFDETLSNAFVITETSEPVGDVEYTLLPQEGATVESLTSVTITFPSLTSVTAGKDINITLNGTNNATATAVTAVEGKTNAFAITFPEVGNGTYTLNIPKGTFTYVLNGLDVPVQAISATYRVQEADFCYDLFDYYRFHYLEGYNPWESITTDQMQNFTLFIYEEPLAIAPQHVYITEQYHPERHLATGHLENITFKDDFGITVYGVKMVFDEEIDTSRFPADYYWYYIPAATIGDGNYAKYLADPESVSKKDCHVNADVYNYTVYVNNVATGMADIRFVNDADIPAYDLQGRIVKSGKRPGVYVRNGHKIVVR